MMFTSKKRLAIAVAGAVSLGATVAHAVDFNATTTLQNTLAVTVVQDFDLGTVFATQTGTALTDGVGGFRISAVDGTADGETGFSASVSLQSLTTPTPAQGAIDTIGTFDLQLPDTSAFNPDDFPANGGTNSNLASITAETPADDAQVVELVHESGDPNVPSLYMLHFTIADTNDGDSDIGTTTPVATNGQYEITPAFGVTTYNFNIGATVITEPTTAAAQYQAGIYSGTFEVTAAY